MRAKPGDRVGALLFTTKDTAHLIGYGTYDGDFKPEGIDTIFDTNPRITLDSGQVVWGYECWWGPEEKIKETVAKCPNVVNVDMEAERKAARS